MAKIKNIEQLREHALLTLERLQNQDIDVAEAGVTGKLCEGVISTIKAQLEYARMTHNDEPEIPFMEVQNQKAIEGTVVPSKSLPSPGRKY